LGPGLLENIYEICLCRELELANLRFERQLELPIVYKGIHLNYDYRVDLVVEKTILVEIKSVAELTPIHDAQVLTYLKLGGWPVGLIFNFNKRKLIDSIRRLVSGLDETQKIPLRSPRLRGYTEPGE